MGGASTVRRRNDPPGESPSRYPTQGHYGGATVLAYVALVLSLPGLAPPLAMLLGVLARRWIRSTGQVGWVVATTAVWIGLVFTVLYAVAFVYAMAI